MFLKGNSQKQKANFSCYAFKALSILKLLQKLDKK